MKGIWIGMIVVALSTTGWACDSEKNSSAGTKTASWDGGIVSAAYAGETKAASMDIVETAIGAGSFNTLVAAVQAADLVETLKGKGPFTVFAPSDEAFAKIPTETLNGLLKDKKGLSAVLTYHVISGNVMAADVLKMDGKKVKTVNGKEVTIRVKDGAVYVDNAKVVATDVNASNGVIHVLDSVMMPK